MLVYDVTNSASFESLEASLISISIIIIIVIVSPGLAGDCPGLPGGGGEEAQPRPGRQQGRPRAPPGH